MLYYDIVIVGGGPAGSTAAYQLQKDGFSVLLVDKQSFPRSKICAGLLTDKTIGILKEVFNKNISDLKNDSIIDYTSNSYKLYYRDELICYQQVSKHFNFVYRSVYDNYLLEMVKASGVDIREGTKVIEINTDDNYLITADGQEISSRYIIAADGANSIIRKQLFKDSNFLVGQGFDNNMAITVEGVIPREFVNLDLNYPVIHYGVINWGYGWLFPKKKEIVIGILGLKNKNKNILTIYKEYLDFLNINIKNVKYMGWPLPYGNYMCRPIYKKILLIGDAAGFVEPVTGEGIYYAHRSGVIAAEVIKKAEMDKQLIIGDYYQQILADSFIKRLEKFKKMRDFLCSKPFFMQKLLIKLSFKFFSECILEKIQYPSAGVYRQDGCE